MKLKLLLSKLKNNFKENTNYIISVIFSFFNLSKVKSSFSQNIIAGAALTIVTVLISTGNIYFIIFGLVLFILFIFIPKSENEKKIPLGLNRIIKRLGTYLSIITTDFIDDKHEYITLERIDLLNYTQGDFYSIRYLHIKNVSSSATTYVPYQECTEHKCTFIDTKVQAYLKKNKIPLHVESVEQPDKKLACHQFKIFFPFPLQPNEEIEIVYSILLPNELNILSSTDEMMSIFLGRIKKKIHELKFNVCLNFVPSSTYATGGIIDNKNEFIEIVDIDGEIKKGNYKNTDWYYDTLNIDWNGQKPICLSLEIKNPKYNLYKLHYKRITK